MYHHILVPLDGSRLAEAVLPHVQACASLDTETQITLLQSVPYTHAPTIEFGGMYSHAISAAEEISRARAAAHDYLTGIADVLRSEGFRVQVEVSHQHAAEAIVDFVGQHHVDLVAIATHGRNGLSRWILGSVTQKVIQVSPVPVLVVRPRST